MQDPRFAARVGNAAGIASFFALSAFGGGTRKRLRVVAGTGAIAALAVGAARRHRSEA